MSQLFGFPSGLSGGSKETVYNTDYPTSHTTNYTTSWNTNRNTTFSSTQNILIGYALTDIGVNPNTGNHEYMSGLLYWDMKPYGESQVYIRFTISNHNGTVNYANDIEQRWYSDNHPSAYVGWQLLTGSSYPSIDSYLTTPLNMGNHAGMDRHFTLTTIIDPSTYSVQATEYNNAGGWNAFKSTSWPSSYGYGIGPKFKISYHHTGTSSRSTSFSTSQSTSKVTNYSTDYTTSHITYG